MATYHRKALIRNMNLEAGELMTRINKKITSLLDIQPPLDLSKIINWDLNQEEDKKCMERVKLAMQNLIMVGKYLDEKMQFKDIEKKCLFATEEEVSDQEILDTAENFSKAYLDP